MTLFHSIYYYLKAFYKKQEYILAVVRLMNKDLVSYERGMELIRELRKIKL